MSFGKASETSTSRLATARYDHRESAGKSVAESLGRIASRFGMAMVLRVPVGYEDATGFHCGTPQGGEFGPPVEPENHGTMRGYF